MNKHNAAVALLSENLTQVLVRFKHSDGNLSPKQYSYMSTIELNSGDEAVVNSPYGGYKVVVVEEVTTATIDIDSHFDYKFIVQRVDKEADEKRQELIKELTFELNEMERQKALKKLRKHLGLRKGDKLSKLVDVLREKLN